MSMKNHLGKVGHHHINIFRFLYFIIYQIKHSSLTLKYFTRRTQRRSKNPMPENSKDDKYWRRRAKNNEAAKRSREAKRQKEDEVLQKVDVLEGENKLLRQVLMFIYQMILISYRTIVNHYQYNVIFALIQEKIRRSAFRDQSVESSAQGRTRVNKCQCKSYFLFK